MKAIKCRCGWVLPGTAQQNEIHGRPHIACCFAGCPEASICSIFTDTGWANVCRTHYQKVKPSSKSYVHNSPAVVEARKAYENSPDYRRRHGIERPSVERDKTLAAELDLMKRRMEETMGRQPGEDPAEPALGIPLDDLERELEERMNP